jgi:hypothetical protein
MTMKILDTSRKNYEKENVIRKAEAETKISNKVSNDIVGY